MQYSGNITVVGGGVMGTNVTYALKTAFPHAEVRLTNNTILRIDNASVMAAGMLAPWSEIDHLPEAFFPAARESMRFWEGFIKDPKYFSRNGSLIVAHDEDRHMLERFAQKLGRAGDNRRLDAAGLHALEPGLSKFAGGIFIPEEALLNPFMAVGQLMHHFGGKNLADGPSDIAKLRHTCDWVIDCRGHEADDPELRGVKGELVVVRNPHFSLRRPVRLMHPRYPLYIVPRFNNTFLIGATVIESAGKEASLKSAMELLSAAYSLHPSFADAGISAIEAGIRPAYPDNLPRIKVNGNVISCNGLFRHGFLLAPVMAQCVADFIAGKENPHISLFLRNHEHHYQRTEEKHKQRA